MSIIRCYDYAGNQLEYLYQWDTNQSVIITDIDAGAIDEVHFCNLDSKEALVVKPTAVDSGVSVEIPNILLQQAQPIVLYTVTDDGDKTAYTINEARIVVVPRPKPSDYVYTETEILSYKSIDDRVLALENSGYGGIHIGPDQPADESVVLWVDTDGASGGSSTLIVTIDEEGMASHTAAEIYAHVQSGGTALLKNDIGITATLSVVGEDAAFFEFNSMEEGLLNSTCIYEDGSIEMYSFGCQRSGRTIPIPNYAKVGQTIVVKAVDSNGRPVLWEAVDLPIKHVYFYCYDADESFYCEDYTAQELTDFIQGGGIVQGAFYDENGVLYFTAIGQINGPDTSESGGCAIHFMVNYGAQYDGQGVHCIRHEPGMQQYYIDGNTNNAVRENELWIL